VSAKPTKTFQNRNALGIHQYNLFAVEEYLAYPKYDDK